MEVKETKLTSDNEEEKDPYRIRVMKVVPFRIFYPKYTSQVDGGNFSIFIANIQEEEGEVLNVESFEIAPIKLKGIVCDIQVGKTYKVHCQLKEVNEQYGETYEILTMSSDIDLTKKNNQKLFLEGILGEDVANKLMSKFDNVIDILENRDIESLKQVKGIKVATALKLFDKYESTKDWANIFIEIGDLGLTPKMISKLMQVYKSPDTVVNIVKNDPYRLVEVNGIGFKKADDIALRVGIEPQSTRRVIEYIKYFLEEEGENGRSYVGFESVLNSIYEYLGNIPTEVLKESADYLKENDIIIVSDDGSTVALRKYFYLEMNIAKELMRLNVDFSKEYPDLMSYDFNDYMEQIKDIEIEQGFEFTDEQKEAIKLSLCRGVIAITGFGGSGKSFLSSAIEKTHQDFHKGEVSGVALAGKASLRLKEATGISCSTIHRLLGYIPEKGFDKDKNNQLSDKFIILDETTMVSGDLFYSLIQSIPTGSKLILLGDINQLTPIGNCHIFNDILESGIIPVVRLNQIHRQAQKSGIIPTSIKVSKEEQVFDKDFYGEVTLGELQDMHLNIITRDDDIKQITVDRCIKEWEKSNREPMRVQIVTMMRTRGDVSAYNLNNEIQQYVNPAFGDSKSVKVFVGKDKNDLKYYNIRVGDKVINNKNNYDVVDENGNRIEVFNGNIGIVTDILDDGNVLIDFEGVGKVYFSKSDMNNIHLAYAVTVHKFQGSSCETVIVAMDNSSYIMNNKEMLYTAITRAKKHCYLIGVNSAIRQAITRREVKNKQTYLQSFLKELSKIEK